MKSNLEKSKLLLSLIGDKGAEILSQLKPEVSKKLTETIDAVDTTNNEEMTLYLNEVVEKINRYELEMVNSGSEDYSTSDYDSDSYLDEEQTEEEEPEEKDPWVEAGFKDIDFVVKMLNDQRPQFVAFILTKLEPHLADILKENLDPDLVSKLGVQPVERLPISDVVYQTVFEDIFIKYSDEEKEEEGY